MMTEFERAVIVRLDTFLEIYRRGEERNEQYLALQQRAVDTQSELLKAQTEVANIMERDEAAKRGFTGIKN
jgi:hypothetical protein